MLGYYYWRQAYRLRSNHPFTISFLPDVVLNLAKAIEIVLSGHRDTARKRARDFGLDSKFIEERIVPILIVRNHLDVGHPATGVLSQEEIKVLSDYSDQAFESVSKLLDDLFVKVNSGAITLPKVDESVGSDRVELISELRQYLEAT